MLSSHLLRHITTSSTYSDELLHKELLDSAAKGKFPLFKSQLTTSLKNTHPKDIFQPKGNKGSPLILAAQKVQSEFTGYEFGGAIALWCAALGGNVNFVRELLEAGRILTTQTQRILLRLEPRLIIIERKL
ncbi:hypothetical protein LOD99_10732 [Oopsacas minuta]|uniref:Uncharacterized protein n=1 Tax=Oopsacas minuta TaxID=111878 RepID=A0AAV7KF55_9METZ|nr:hypothetical protein LOD99_10732 [Oopsacas minuta]